MQTSGSALRAEPEPGRGVRRLSFRLLLSAGIAAFFVWVLRAGALPLVPENGLWRSLRGWTVLGYLAGWSLVHLIRAARWQLLLAPLATVRLRRIFAASFLGFLAILMFPLRTGEVVRPMLIRDRRRLTVWAAAGTLGAERIVDGLVLSGILFVALLLAHPLDPLPERLGDLPIRVSLVPTTAYLALIAFSLALLGMLAFHVWKGPTRRLVERIVGAVSPRFAHWVSTRLEGLAEGLSFLSGPRHALPFVLATLAYWLLNAACTWLLAWGTGLSSFGFTQACTVTGVLAIGVLVPNAPGFFGAFQFSVYAALALFYPREQVLGQGALFVFLLYLGQMAVTVGFAAWAAWLGGLGREERAVAARSAEL
ncbi:MAG TPA: lysylphosphatidylglycerol synthase transmembrane domain-containing protein [Polyangiaceae bacterium]|nr:lysylphosphatidylglycerol synthase transmembrane domain-containing protein [Polyangiaceae bacterium]